MRETWDLIRAWRELPPDAHAVLATVVHTSGSTYRKAGARMLLSDERRLAGSISGGCLEGDLISTGWDLSAEGPKLVTYDATSDDDIVWGFGVGCNGVVEVLVERVTADSDILRALALSLENDEMVVVVTSLDREVGVGRRWFVTADCDCEMPEGLERAAREMLGVRGQAVNEIEGVRYYLESHLAPRRLLIFGAGHDAPPLASLAHFLGWKVTVVDHREAYAKADRFPENASTILVAADKVGDAVQVRKSDAAVVMSHHYLNDRAVLHFLLGTEASYIGVLGPSKRTERMLAELGAVRDHRLHAPIGLDIGAEGPHEIALATMAEIQAFLKGKQGLSLNNRQAS